MKILDIQKRRAKGQSTIELTVLLIIVMGALLAGQVYFKRGIQGRWKTAVDELSEELYDPFLTDSNITYRTASNSTIDITSIEAGGGSYWTMRIDATNSVDTREGTHVVGGYN